MMATAVEVATWMASRARAEGLRQRTAATEIIRRFGYDFVYRNRTGRWSIAKSVLKEFKTMTRCDVVWAKRPRAWRRRLPNDPPDVREVWR